MTIALEHIQPDDWAAVNRAVDTLRSLTIDTGGVSLFVRAGAVTSAGAVLAGSGFTVTKNATGDYTVSLTFPRTPLVVVGTGTTAAFITAKLSATTPPSTAGFRVFTFTTSTAVAADGEFHWIAIA
jgi:hypothetical protein